MKRSNDYAAAFGPLYSRIPKAVFAAVAFSHCLRILGNAGDIPAEVGVDAFLAEWHTLHLNGLVAQRPPALGFCTGCLVRVGGQHLPHCARQGLVSAASDYRDKPGADHA